MTRYWLTGAAAFAMMTGVAFAQGTTDSSTITRSTTSTAPAALGHHSSALHRDRDNDRYGNMVHTKKIIHHGLSGSSVTTKTRTASPDGARTTYREMHTASPYSGSSTEKKTTTTTLDR